MPAGDFTVNMAIRADIRNLRRNLNTAKRQWRNFGRDVNRIGRQMGAALKVGGAVAAGGLTAVIRTGAQFEKSLSELSAITGATGKQLDILGKSARTLAKTSSFSAGQTVKAFKLVASAKPDLLESSEALTEVTKNALTLAEAAGLELPAAANALGTSLNQFGAGAEQAGRFINVLAAGSKFGAASIEDVAVSMKNAGTVASSLGVSFEEANAAIQALGASGLKAGEAGTALRAVLLKMEKEGGDFSVTTHGMVGALQNLANANLTTAELTKIFGLESVTAAGILSGAAGTVADLTQKLTGTAVATEQAARQMDNLEGDAQLLKSAIAELFIGEYDEGGVGDWARGVVQGVTRVVNHINDSGKTIGEYFVNITRAIGGFSDAIILALKAWIVFKAAALTAGVVALLLRFGSAIVASAKAMRALTLSTALFGKVLKRTGLGLALAGIAVAAGAITEEMTKTEQDVGVVGSLLGSLTDTYDDLTGTIGGVGDELQDLTDTFLRGASAGVSASDEIALAMGDISDEAVKLVDGVQTLSASYKMTSEDIGESLEDVEKEFENLSDLTIRETKHATDEFTDLWLWATRSMENAFRESIHTGLWESATRGFRDFGRSLVNIWKQVVSEIVATWLKSGIINLLSGAGVSIGGSVASGVAGGLAGRAAGAAGLGGLFGSLGPVVPGIGAIAGSGFLGGLGASLSSGGFGLFSIGANAGLAGGGIAATIGAALPAIGAITAGAYLIKNILFGSKKVTDSGLELRADGAGFDAASFSDIRKRRLFGRTRRYTNYSSLEGEVLQELRTLYSGVRNTTGKALEDIFGLSSRSLNRFTETVKVSLRGLDEAEKEAALTEAFRDLGAEMLRFGLRAGGVRVPLEGASDALKGILGAAEQVQAAAGRAELLNTGRVDTLGIFRQHFEQLSNEQLKALLSAARRRSTGTEASEQIINAIQSALNTRSLQAEQSGIIGSLLKETGIVVTGINDLAVSAQEATRRAFSGLGDALESSARRFLERARRSVERLTEITGNSRDDPAPRFRTEIPEFARGGIVPGAIGAPVLAMVHGGEEVIPYSERGRGGNVINVSINVTGDVDSATLRALRNNAQEAAVIIADASI